MTLKCDKTSFLPEPFKNGPTRTYVCPYFIAMKIDVDVSSAATASPITFVALFVLKSHYFKTSVL